MAGHDETLDKPQEHGGNLSQAQRLFPDAPKPWIDLSTGINPWAYPLPPIPAQAWTALPSPDDARALEAIAARYYGVPSPNFVVATPGTQAAIQWLPRLVAPSHVAVLSPTYGEHAHGWELAGHRVSAASSVAALADADIAVIVNPNNPDGRIHDAETLLSLATAKHINGGFLLLDEAFADVMPELSLAAQVGTPGLVILRSVGKFFGLAGIRLGFVLAPTDLAQRLRVAMGPWAVSGEALIVGRQALADTSWQDNNRRRLKQAAGALDAILAPMGTIVGGTDLYRLLETTDAPALFYSLGDAGLWVRRFAYNPAWLRFGLPPDEAAMARLQEATEPHQTREILRP